MVAREFYLVGHVSIISIHCIYFKNTCMYLSPERIEIWKCSKRCPFFFAFFSLNQINFSQIGCILLNSRIQTLIFPVTSISWWTLSKSGRGIEVSHSWPEFSYLNLKTNTTLHQIMQVKLAGEIPMKWFMIGRAPSRYGSTRAFLPIWNLVDIYPT